MWTGAWPLHIKQDGLGERHAIVCRCVDMSKFSPLSGVEGWAVLSARHAIHHLEAASLPLPTARAIKRSPAKISGVPAIIGPTFRGFLAPFTALERQARLSLTGLNGNLLNIYQVLSTSIKFSHWVKGHSLHSLRHTQPITYISYAIVQSTGDSMSARLCDWAISIWPSSAYQNVQESCKYTIDILVDNVEPWDQAQSEEAFWATQSGISDSVS